MCCGTWQPRQKWACQMKWLCLCQVPRRGNTLYNFTPLGARPSPLGLSIKCWPLNTFYYELIKSNFTSLYWFYRQESGSHPLWWRDKSVFMINRIKNAFLSPPIHHSAYLFYQQMVPWVTPEGVWPHLSSNLWCRVTWRPWEEAIYRYRRKYPFYLQPVPMLAGMSSATIPLLHISVFFILMIGRFK